MPVAYRADQLVNDKVIVELKAVESIIDKHEDQLQTELILGNFRVGLLLNFHEAHLKNGIRRRVNDF